MDHPIGMVHKVTCLTSPQLVVFMSDEANVILASLDHVAKPAEQEAAIQWWVNSGPIGAELTHR